MIWIGHRSQAVRQSTTSTKKPIAEIFTNFIARFLARLQPALLAIPVGGILESLQRVDPWLPQLRRAGALGLDHPIAVREIGGAIDGEFRLFAAQQLVGPGGEAQQDPGRRDDGGPGAYGSRESARELAVRPATGLAVICLNQNVRWHGGPGKRY